MLTWTAKVVSRGLDGLKVICDEKKRCEWRRYFELAVTIKMQMFDRGVQTLWANKTSGPQHKHFADARRLFKGQNRWITGFRFSIRRQQTIPI